MTPDQLAIIRTIAESPDDDVPRLIYCDWLEENGQVERAEFIRLQLEQAALPPRSPRFDTIQRRIDAYILSCVQAWREAELPNYPGIGWGAYERGFVRELSIYREAGLEQFVAHQDEFLGVAPLECLSFMGCLHAECGRFWLAIQLMPMIRTIRFVTNYRDGTMHHSNLEHMISRGLLNDARRIEWDISDPELILLHCFLNARRWPKLEELAIRSYARYTVEEICSIQEWQNLPALRFLEWGYTQTIQGHELRGESRPAS